LQHTNRTLRAFEKGLGPGDCGSQICVETIGFLRALATAQSDQGYAAKRTVVSREDVAAHLNGDVTLGFSVLRGGVALFVAIRLRRAFSDAAPGRSTNCACDWR
jgi:hypothetical protein